MIATALEAEGTLTEGTLDSKTLRLEITRALSVAEEPAPPFSAIREAARKTRQHVSRSTAQHLYDYLIRHAELVANFADRRRDRGLRLRLRKLAVKLYEFAEELRCGTFEGDEKEELLNLSARPTNTAGRLCLTIGKALYNQGKDADDIELISTANGYFSRAAYGSYQLISQLARYQIERVGALVFEAHTVRVRSQLSLTPNLDAALEVLRATETSLIHYPSRLQLWLRFYLERAQLFRDRAKQLGSKSTETAICLRYSQADVESVKRLAGGRKLWLDLADEVLKLSPPPVQLGELATSRSAGTLRRSSNKPARPTH